MEEQPGHSRNDRPYVEYGSVTEPFRHARLVSLVWERYYFAMARRLEANPRSIAELVVQLGRIAISAEGGRFECAFFGELLEESELAQICINFEPGKDSAMKRALSG